MSIRAWNEGDLEQIVSLLGEFDEALGENQEIDRFILPYLGKFGRMEKTGFGED